MTELIMAPPSIHQGHIETGSEYTFSSSSLRKKKKKFRNKKVITTEEAASRKCRPRSRSTSALQTATSAVVTPPSPPPPQPTPVVIAAPASPVQKESNKSKSRGQQELDRELELSSHNREVRKPWETDIRKKEKTEYGDSLLRDGPCSADRIQSSSAASHHANFQRARILSTTRHRSVSRQRSQSRRGRSSLQLFSDWHTSDSEEEYYREPQLEEPSSFDDDEDVTYEKYRQFLASTKSNDEDDTLSRQSVLSLKQKVGAAPALEFSYRYSAAADELLNGESNYDNCDNNQLESKSNTEETTNITDPEDLSVTAVPPMQELFSEDENDEDDNSTDGNNRQPISPGSIMRDEDARSDREKSDSPQNDQESSSVVESQPSTPLHSPITSPHPPYLTDSSSPLKKPPTPTSVTSEELSLPPLPQPPQQEQRYNSKEASEKAILNAVDKPQHEISNECAIGQNEVLVSDPADFPTRQDDLSSNESQPHRLQKQNKVSRFQESDPEIDSPRPPSRESSCDSKKISIEHLFKENVESDDERMDLYNCMDVHNRKSSRSSDLDRIELPILRYRKSPYAPETTGPIQGRIDDVNCGHPSDESDYQPTRRQNMVRDRSPIPDVAKIEPIEDIVKEKCVEEAISTELVQMQDEDSINEDCDEESIEDTDYDSDYPEEDRMLLNMMYGIHMG